MKKVKNSIEEVKKVASEEEQRKLYVCGLDLVFYYQSVFKTAGALLRADDEKIKNAITSAVMNVSVKKARLEHKRHLLKDDFRMIAVYKSVLAGFGDLLCKYF